ncbi:MAG: sigma-54-dependent Fis family transcriptional regulator [Acidobacteria bacterium]|nr:sigma-54-dependent Fis family transcriptional regulator [Acidobacteriota bacterium]
MTPEPKMLLLVDDDDSLRRVLHHHLTQAGYQVLTAANGEDGLRLYTENPVSLVITDVLMEGMDGTELLRRIRALSDEAMVIVITAHGTIEAAVTAMKLGAFDYITKPFNREELLLTVSKGLQFTDLVRENKSLKRFINEHFSITNLVGASTGMRKVLTLVEKVARTDAIVLITGESGTGKELIAKAIHQNSRRRDKPFVVINCGAIPEGLLESELFGHKKGAFTGAIADARGVLESAEGGTVFLDEIGELPLSLQVKLLRVLQEGEFLRVGDHAPHRVNVRFLAATNRSLDKMIAEGDFREDLYFRLNVVPLVLPPLRDRREDIPILADMFLTDLANKYSRPYLRIEKDVFRYLGAYPWPGNIRELKNTIERMVVLAEGDTITLSDLPEPFIKPAATVGRVTLHLPDEGIDLDAVEKEILVQALEKNGWNQTHTARYLSLTRSALIYRMQKFALDEHSYKRHPA